MPPPSASLSSLTAREREVLSLIAAGLSTAQIADRLHRSQRTIETHRHALGRKLGARNRVELTHIAIRAGLYGTAATDDRQFDTQRYREALVAGQAGCWEWDLQQHRLTMNATMEHVLGLSADEPRSSQELLERVHAEDRESIRNCVRAHLDGEADRFEVTYRWQHPSGRWLRLLSRGQAGRGDADAAQRITGITVVLDAARPTA